jgi:hypothetical protein
MRIKKKSDKIKSDKIEKYLKSIDSRLQNIEISLEEIKKSNLKLDEHVNFVDSVFETCKKPFNNLLSIYTGSNVNIYKNKTEYKLEFTIDK